jgi:hypothetical protein
VPRGKKDMIQDSKVAYAKFQEFIYKVKAWDEMLGEPTDIIMTIKDEPGPLPESVLSKPSTPKKTTTPRTHTAPKLTLPKFEPMKCH